MCRQVWGKRRDMALHYDFSDRVALITGGSQGIGASVAAAFVQAGAAVAITARSNDRLQQTAAELRNDGGRSVPNVRVELARIIDEQSTEKLDARVTGETGEFVFRLAPDTAKYRLTVKTPGAQVDSKDVTVDGPAVYRVSLSFKPVPK